MSNGRSVDSKEGAVDEGVSGRQTRNTILTKLVRKRKGNVLGRGIVLVGSLIEQCLVVDGQRNFVGVASVIKYMVRVNREVAGVPGVCEPDSSNDGEGEESAKENL